MPPLPSSREGGVGDRPPAVQLEFRIERERDAHVLASEPRRRLARPRAGHQQRRSSGQAVPQGCVDAFVHGMAAAEAGRADDQQPLVGAVSEPLRQRFHIAKLTRAAAMPAYGGGVAARRRAAPQGVLATAAGEQGAAGGAASRR